MRVADGAWPPEPRPRGGGGSWDGCCAAFPLPTQLPSGVSGDRSESGSWGPGGGLARQPLGRAPRRAVWAACLCGGWAAAEAGEGLRRDGDHRAALPAGKSRQQPAQRGAALQGAGLSGGLSPAVTSAPQRRRDAAWPGTQGGSGPGCGGAACGREGPPREGKGDDPRALCPPRTAARKRPILSERADAPRRPASRSPADLGGRSGRGWPPDPGRGRPSKPLAGEGGSLAASPAAAPPGSSHGISCRFQAGAR